MCIIKDHYAVIEKKLTVLQLQLYCISDNCNSAEMLHGDGPRCDARRKQLSHNLELAR